MKNVFAVLLTVFMFCCLSYFAGTNRALSRQGGEVVKSDTVWVYESVDPDSGQIYAVMQKSALSDMPDNQDSLLAVIDSLLRGYDDIKAETRIDVSQGSMQVGYSYKNNMFDWLWSPEMRLREVELRKIEISSMRIEKKWYERWYVTIPIGFLIGYGVEKIL